jgi:hypothetical protein
LIKSYKKKPIVIQAVQFTEKNISDVLMFTGPSNVYLTMDPENKKVNCYMVKTLEGPLKISEHDYVIKGIQGEFYPCKPDIFKATYEEMN